MKTLFLIHRQMLFITIVDSQILNDYNKRLFEIKSPKKKHKRSRANTDRYKVLEVGSSAMEE